ncbi:MAG: hypothetical protein R3C19_04620 [Planctomycetaceae bacterium]
MMQSTLVLRLLAVVGAITTAVSGRAAIADEWTTLRGRIVVSGEIPEPEPLEITRDEEVCGKVGLVDESLVVDGASHGVRNVVIWLYSKNDAVPVHESYAELKDQPATLNNEDCRFVPRIVTLRTGQVLQATNSDPVSHNVAVYGRRNSPFSIVVPQNQPLERIFQREELLPLRVDCSIHAWMKAYIVVTEHPYAVATDQEGRFELRNVPNGKWQFRFWHERPGYIKSLTQGDTSIALERGIWEVGLQGGELDLGELSVDAAMFSPED